MKILEVRNLKKSFQEGVGRIQVLENIILEVQAGEKIAITGESGSGKSTLLHLLGMLDTPDSGEIIYSRKNIDSKNNRLNVFRNKKIGFVFQAHYLLEDFTAEENVAMPMFIATQDMKRSKRKAHELLKILNILERKNHFPNQLSGGEQQRVAIARALINDPEIVFADEPTGNLDSKHSDELIKYVIELNEKRGQTFVIATHDKNIAKQMDKHYNLKDGKLYLVEKSSQTE